MLIALSIMYILRNSQWACLFTERAHFQCNKLSTQTHLSFLKWDSDSIMLSALGISGANGIDDPLNGKED